MPHCSDNKGPASIWLRSGSGDRGLVVVGRHSIDFGILGRRIFRYAKLVAGGLSTVSLVLLYAAVRASLGELHWWMEYGRNSSPFRVPTLLRTMGPVLWCLVLASGCLI